MTKDRERLTLYFNTDVEIERKMWEYINKDGKNRKSYNIKKLIEMAMDKIEYIPLVKDEIKVVENDNSTIITTDNDDISLDDLPF